MRITGGYLRGRRLLGAGGNKFRPTQGRVREALFSMLGDLVREAQVADLFAGVGSLGIEALSRGARQVIFVEHAPQAVSLLTRNLAELGLKDQAEIVPSPVERFLESPGPFSYDLVLADPPYRQGLAQMVLREAAGRGLIAPRGTIVLECGGSEGALVAPPGWESVRRQDYGDTRLEFFRRGTYSPEGQVHE